MQHDRFCRQALTLVNQVLIQHRASDAALHLVENILRSFGSRFVYLSYDEHDLVTANTQGVIHAAFLTYVPSSNFTSRSAEHAHPT